MRIAPEVATTLAAQRLEDFVVPNGPERTVTEVATDILRRLSWSTPET
jgi:hypothetical protein